MKPARRGVGGGRRRRGRGGGGGRLNVLRCRADIIIRDKERPQGDSNCNNVAARRPREGNESLRCVLMAN